MKRTKKKRSIVETYGKLKPVETIYGVIGKCYVRVSSEENIAYIQELASRQGVMDSKLCSMLLNDYIHTLRTNQTES